MAEELVIDMSRVFDVLREESPMVLELAIRRVRIEALEEKLAAQNREVPAS